MIPRTMIFLLSLLLLTGCTSVRDDSIEGLPLHVERLGDRAIRLWVGDHVSSTAVSALATANGIVVIDTTESPTLDEHFRKIIAREFGRDDFAYLINTHEHADHTTGNGVYADCEIVAHETCAEGMRQQREGLPRTLEWYGQRIPELEAELAGTEEGTEAHAKLREELAVKTIVRETLQEAADLTFPTRTFSDSMTLDLGDTIFELFYMGGTHTASDIAVLVPERGLLFTGDMMADTWLTDTPGCLQAFAMRQGVRRDMPMLLEHWQKLIALGDRIKRYVPAHWNGELSREGFVARYEYVETLLAGVAEAVANGTPLDDLMTEFDLQVRFPGLAGTPGFTENWVHYGSILALWSDATGAESASNALAALIEDLGPEAAVTEISKARADGSPAYYFLEGEFNGLGYRYLGEERYEEAVAVFAMNAELYPDSWNVHDSLGEAYLASGRPELAMSHYLKSVDLNPENENGKRFLAEIKTTLASN